MERSLSCSCFDASKCIRNDGSIGNNNSNNNNNNNISGSSKPHLDKQIDVQLQHAESSDNLSKLNKFNANVLPFFKPLSKRAVLQRQKSTTHYDDDDIDYAADLEEEGIEDEVENEDKHKSRHSMSKFQLQQLPNRRLQNKIRNFSDTLGHHSSIDDITVNCAITDARISTIIAENNTSVSTSTAITSSCTTAVQKHQLTKNEQLSFDAATNMSPLGKRHAFGMLKRDNSVQSDSSRYSSVDSLLESRKPDPEAILINLGFGPVGSEDILSRIPKRFLKPSQVRGIDTEAFVKRLQLAANLADHSALGYRGLTGNPDIPPSTIVAKIMQRFEVNERKKSMGSLEHTIR